MSEDLLNRFRFEAERVHGNTAKTRIGIVSSYDPNRHAIKATLQPDGTETGWIPLGSPWIGNGWGLFAPPSIGDQIKIEFQEADPEVPLTDGRFFSDVNLPVTVQSGEFWLIHKSGTAFKLTNDGKMLMNSGAEIDIGNLQNTVERLVTEAFLTLYNNHTHTCAGSGSPSSTPIVQMTAAQLTTILKAN